MFYKHSSERRVTILIVYVDDIILTRDDVVELDRLKKAVACEFEIKDLRPLKYFLRIEFERSKKGIFISQRKYICDLLGVTGLLGCKATETPIEPNLKLQQASLEEMVNKERYQRLVGRLIYLSHTHLDIALAVSVVSQVMHSPNQGHFDDVCIHNFKVLETDQEREFYMKIRDIFKLKCLLMQIGQEMSQTENQLPDIVPLGGKSCNLA